ncbi:MAG: hypothetical protein QM657_19475 [Lacrimispora sp.]|uniref:hypothetical protein n=1 Tax=Lacrimispora sp. TaxID=2719234 RepID=UPI0039E45674
MRKKYKNTLLEFARQLNLTLDTQMATIFGLHNGYSVFLSPVNETYQFILSLSVRHGNEMPNIKTMKQAVPTSKAVTGCSVRGYRVSYTLRAGMTANKTLENLREGLESITNYLRENSFENCCQSCGTPGAADPYNISGASTLLCDHCFSDHCETAAVKEVQQNQKKENLIGGIVGALLGSLIGVAVIILLGQLGYVAALSGLVLGVCSLKGYELLGGRLSKKGIVISIAIMLVMVYIGNRADWAISAANYFEDLDVFSAFQLIPVLLEEGYLESGVYYGDLAMVYIFTVVGAVPTIIAALRAKKQENASHKMSGD